MTAAADEEYVPLLWPSVALAFIVLLTTMGYYGWAIPFPKTDPPLPEFIWHLSEGAVKAPNFAYLVPALLIGLGSSLGAKNVLNSLKFALPGIVIIAFVITLIMLWSNIANTKSGPGGFTNEAVAGVILGHTMLAFFSFLLLVKPLLIGAAAVAVIVHFIWYLLDEAHGEWLYDNAAHNAPSGLLLDAGIGAAVILLAVWSYWGAGAVEEGAWRTPEEVVAALDPPYRSGPWSQSAKGLDRMQIRLNDIVAQIEEVAKNPCDYEARRELKYQTNKYFKSIRIYEDWQVGRPLTAISQATLERTAKALKAGYLSWDELLPAVKIHFDEERDRPLNEAARERLACG